MHFLKLLPLCCSLLFAAAASAQKPGTPEKDQGKPPVTPAPKLKPLSELLPPQEILVGVWLEITAAGREYATFMADGRLIMQRGPETMNLKYRVDTSAKPWKLDMDIKLKGTGGTIYTVFEFPAPDQFRMAPPSADKEKRPDAEGLKNTKSLMKRVTLAAHEGISQVVEAALNKLAGAWEGKDGAETATLTFTAAGEYTMKVADFTDKGRFSINVKKVPMTIDLLSSEGTGMKYSIVGFTDDGQLRVGSATANPAERQTAFEDISAKTYKKKEAPPADNKKKKNP